MTTSASFDFSLTSAGVVAVAFENLGVLAAGGSVTTNDLTTAQRRLNLLAKQYQGRSDGAPGLKVHTRQRVSLVLAKGQQTYLIGPASGDSRSTTLLGRTTVSGAYASGTSLNVAALTDTTSYPGTTITMTAADIIGVQLDDGTVSWTTISAAASSPITLGGALASAASVGKYVYWFTSRAQRLVYLESAVLRNSSFNDMPLNVYTDVREYELGVADKQADSQPISILFEPLRLNTRITLNSQPTDVSQQIVLTGFYPAEDYDSATGADDIAFPQEALRFLSWELSFELAPAYGVTWTQAMDLNRKEARSMYLNLNPEMSVDYFRGTGV